MGKETALKKILRLPGLLVPVLFQVLLAVLAQGRMANEAFALDCKTEIALEVTDADPNDIVSGTVTGVNPDQVWVVVFARTNQWYIQPYADARAYLPVNPDGTFETWIRDWKQVSAFVIQKGYDVLSESEPHKPFPLAVDCGEVLAVAAHPAIRFSGSEWAIKAGDQLGPGPNDFSASSENVWVDGQGRLHLRITYREGNWVCAEVYAIQPLGYGRYVFYVSGPVDSLDKNMVASPFLYQDDVNELDVEFSRWGVEQGPNAQFVIQPWTLPDHREQFFMHLDGEDSSHLIEWTPGTVFFRSAQGHDPNPSQGQIVHVWSYTGTDVPVESNEMLVHLNLWLYEGQSPSDGQEAEIVIESIEFEPWNEDNSCLVDAAVFGSKVAKKIVVLKAFRDKHLLANSSGTAFVKAYYTCSPSIAALVAEHSWLRILVQILLFPLIGFALLLV
jgi:hypothetical protein